MNSPNISFRVSTVSKLWRMRHVVSGYQWVAPVSDLGLDTDKHGQGPWGDMIGSILRLPEA